jgi:hypothetical protein
MVLTQAGSNYRQFSIINVIRDPVRFVHILLNRFSHLDKIDVANKPKISIIYYLTLQNEVLCYGDVEGDRYGIKEANGKMGKRFAITRLDKDLVEPTTRLLESTGVSTHQEAKSQEIRCTSLPLFGIAEK